MARKATALMCVLCLGVLVGVSFADQGHQGHQGQMDAAAHAENLRTELNLTAEQTEQVESVFAALPAATMEKIEPLRTGMQSAHAELRALQSDDGSADADTIAAKEDELRAIRGEINALFEERDEALKEILTAEQFAKFQELAKAHLMGHQGEGHPHQ